MNVHPLYAIAALTLVVGCTASNPDATRSNCKLAQDGLDLASAAVYEYQQAKPGTAIPTQLTTALTTAKATQALVCG